MEQQMNFTQEQINAIVEEAQVEARRAAEAFHAQYGDRDCCGFAWTNIYGVKGNTRVGKMLKAAGKEVMISVLEKSGYNTHIDFKKVINNQ
jgi:hypothetical protein